MIQLDELEERVLKSLTTLTLNHNKFTIGLSGGVDSVCLLSIITKIKKYLNSNINIDAIHINHGISPNAIYWQNFCISLCNNLDIKITTVSHKVKKGGGESLENNARCVRYNEYTNLQSSVIILAHHLNDQVETILSQIFRGSEIHNIGGMRVINKKSEKIFFRPLLNTTKSQLLEYACKNNLTFINDESNLDNKYLRNLIRNEVIPKVLLFDNNLIFKLAKFSNNLHNTLDILDEIGMEDLQKVSIVLTINNNFYNNNVINIDQLIKLNINRQKNLLCIYLKINQLGLPSENQIKEFVRQVVQSKYDKRPILEINSNFKLIKIKNHIGLIKS